MYGDAPEDDAAGTDEATPTKEHVVFATATAQDAHIALRSVCRRWRGIADWVRLASAMILVEALKLTNADAVRLRHPAAIEMLSVITDIKPDVSHTDFLHFTHAPRALSSLVGGHPHLRRSLTKLSLGLCCPPLLLRVVPPAAACTTLTSLEFIIGGHKRQRRDDARIVPSNVLAPLSALPLLQKIGMLTLATKSCGARAGAAAFARQSED